MGAGKNDSPKESKTQNQLVFAKPDNELLQSDINRETSKYRFNRVLPATNGAISSFQFIVSIIADAYWLSISKIQMLLSEEREAGSVLAIAPLIFGAGICAYFLGANEPLLVFNIFTFLTAIAFAVTLKSRSKLWFVLVAIALFMGGMTAAKLRTDYRNTIFLEQQVTANISGTIINVSRNSRGAPRYLIAPDNIENLITSKMPALVRLSAHSKHAAGLPGDRITGLARMQPVTGPVYPGGYDFSFNHWFRGLGATGFFMGRPDISEVSKHSISDTFANRYGVFINGIRTKLASRLRASLEGEKGEIAVALIVGDRSGLSKSTQQSLRDSGLAHVLAISGMHMALVCLTFIWAFRLLLALNLKLAQSIAVKNLAALGGFVIATSYLAISGGGVATQRAWIMISVVLLATLIDRKALTMRSVVIAAMAVLVLQPESILSPGFQMSFAAVAAIIAAWELLDNYRVRNYEAGWWKKILRFIATLAFTSLVAGSATAIIAAWHFQQFAVYGVITNLLAMPIVSLLVMPLALLAMLLMPYGLEQLPLLAMGQGIEWVIQISNFINAIGDVQITGKLERSILPLTGLALFILTMFKTRLRLLAIIPMAGVALLWGTSKPPDILLSQDGRAIAVKTANGMSLLYPRRNKFVTDIWKKAWPDKWESSKKKIGTSNLRCDKEMCIRTLQNGGRLYVVYDPKLLKTGCKQADILFAPRLRWVNCYGKQIPHLIVKRGDLEEFGSQAIYLTNSQSKPANEKLKKPKKSKLSNRETNSAHAEQISKFSIARIETTFTDNNRPWQVHRKGRAQYLQD